MSVMRTWIAQPQGTPLCGQVAVAVITGAPLEDVIARVGHKRGTKTWELVRVLDSYGYGALGRARALSVPPTLALGILRHPTWKRNWHWVVIDGPHVWDGLFGAADGKVYWPSDARVTSYVPVFEP